MCYLITTHHFYLLDVVSVCGYTYLEARVYRGCRVKINVFDSFLRVDWGLQVQSSLCRSDHTRTLDLPLTTVHPTNTSTCSTGHQTRTGRSDPSTSVGGPSIMSLSETLDPHCRCWRLEDRVHQSQPVWLYVLSGGSKLTLIFYSVLVTMYPRCNVLPKRTRRM